MAKNGPVTAKSLFVRTYGWLGLVFIGIGLIALGFAVSNYNHAMAPGPDGQRVSAEVVCPCVRPVVEGGESVAHHYIVVSFALENGDVVQAEQRVPARFNRPLQRGDTIKIRYLRSDPSVIEVQFARAWSWVFFLTPIALGALGFGIYWTLTSWAWAVGAIRLRESGVRREVEVIGHYNTTMSAPHKEGVPGENPTMVRLKWREDNGTVGYSIMASEVKLNKHIIGSKISVFSDPEGRLSSVWAGDVEAAETA